MTGTRYGVWVFVLASFLCVTLPACAPRADDSKPPSVSAYDPKRVVRIDDALTGTGMYMLHYRGRWEHVHGYRDGRDDGTSSRTPYAGDGLSSTFEGQGLRIYGVVGPKGGSAILGIDGTSTTARVSFYSATKRTHVLVYQSPPLSPGPHVFALVANGGQRHETYVNIDDVEIVR